MNNIVLIGGIGAVLFLCGLLIIFYFAMRKNATEAFLACPNFKKTSSSSQGADAGGGVNDA